MTGSRGTVTVLAAGLSAGVTAWLVGAAASRVSGDRMAPWIIGRASGVCSYLLLVALVLTGLVLSHPWRARVRRPSAAARIRIHITLAAFTLVFTALHVAVLATDPYAGVGWTGAFLPLQAQYRPVATTLGVIGFWSGVVAGVTALFAGRLPRRAWWPVHKVAAAALVIVWLHGVFGGGDTPALLGLYLGTGALVVAVGLSRYVARTPADRAAELAEFVGTRR